MTEYSEQPNLQNRHLSGPVATATLADMAKRGPYGKTQKQPVALRPRTFVKEWRLFREMTVEELAEAAEMSPGNLSALENRKQGYSDDGLERLAYALKTTPGALLSVNPLDPATGDFWNIWDRADKEQRRQLSEIARTIVPVRHRAK